MILKTTDKVISHTFVFMNSFMSHDRKQKRSSRPIEEEAQAQKYFSARKDSR
jgi:hypothetical protein